MREKIIEDGIEYDVKTDASGYKFWYLNGVIHRENGPAIECDSGVLRWYRNGKRHREDGPAVIYDDGSTRWYLNGIKYSEEEYKKEMRERKLTAIS